MHLVDTHCHLTFSPLSKNRNQVLNRARAAMVTRIVVPAYDESSIEHITHLVEGDDAGTIKGALGRHPWVSDQPFDAAMLERQLRHCHACAVGEIGLDSKIAVPIERQQTIFEQQLAIARDLDLPVLIHCRGAFEKLIHSLMRVNKVRPVFHAFSRGPELAQRLISLGGTIAVGGAATRPRAKQIKRTLRAIDLSNLLLETDAPSIGLEGVLPEKTEPAHVHQIAAAVADLTNQTIAQVARATTNNALELFGPWDVSHQHSAINTRSNYSQRV